MQITVTEYMNSMLEFHGSGFLSLFRTPTFEAGKEKELWDNKRARITKVKSNKVEVAMLEGTRSEVLHEFLNKNVSC